MVNERSLGIDHVMNGHHGKVQGVGPSGLRVDRTGTCRAFAPSDDVGANDEVFSRVEGFARADHDIPPAGLAFVGMIEAGGVGVAGKRMKNQNGVVFGRAQFTIGLVGQSDGAETSPALEEHFLGRLGEGEGLRLNNPNRTLVVHDCRGLAAHSRQFTARLRAVPANCSTAATPQAPDRCRQ